MMNAASSIPAPSCRRSLRAPLILVALVLLAGGAGDRWLRGMLLAADAVPLALKAPLASFPMNLGEWKGTDLPMSERVLEVAGCDDHVYRRYVQAKTGATVDLYVAYAARPAKMLSHRPEVCYPAHGWTPLETRRHVLTCTDPPELNCLIHRFARMQPLSEEMAVLNYYILAGRYITDWTEFWGPAWRLPNLARDPEFYVVQVQISAVISRMPTLRAAETSLEVFAAMAAPTLDRLLVSNSEKTNETKAP